MHRNRGRTFGSLTPAQISSLSPDQISSLSAYQIGGLTAPEVGGLTLQQVAALSATQIGELTTSAIQGLTAVQLVNLSEDQVTGLTSAQIAAFTPGQISALTQTDVSDMNGAEVGGLTASELGAFTLQQLAALSATQIGELTTSAIQGLTAVQLVNLSETQVAGLTAAQIAAFTPDQISALTENENDQADSLNFADPGAWTASDVAALTLQQIATLSAAQIGALTTSAIQGFTADQLDSLSETQVAGLTTAQVAAFTPDQISALMDDQVDALVSLGPGQIAGLTGSDVAALTLQQLASFSAAQIGELTTSAIQGLTPVQLVNLSETQVTGLTAAQIAAFTSTQISALTTTEIDEMSPTQLAALPDAPVIPSDPVNPEPAVAAASNVVTADIAALESNGSLSYASMLQILRDAAVGGMTPAKFAALQTLAGELNVAGGISTSAYVQQIADDVINGNSANAYWNGGSSAATALGDLTANSSQAEVDDLIGKWFLGTDLPSIDMTDVNGGNLPAQYEAVNLPLFGANGPSYADVSQGNVGDCYFVAALAETAMQDPSLIENMIQANGNGTYSVEFHVNGADDFVTVNDELPVMLGGYEWNNGSTLEFDNSSTLWSPLIEKAYAQLMEQIGVTPGTDTGQNGDSYADISGGNGQGISLITGQQYDTYSTSPGENTSSLASTLQNDLLGGQEVLLATSDNAVTGNLVAGHTFEVISINAAADTAILQNPWNTAASGTSQAMQFTISLGALAQDQATFYASHGSAAAA